MGWLVEILEKIKEFLPSAVDLGIGAATTFSLYAVISYPWDLYFYARHTRIEAEESKKLGINVSESDYNSVRSIENRALFTSIFSHFASAGAVYGIGHITNEQVIRKRTAIFFLASILVRPTYSAYSYLYQKLDSLLQKTYYPREDVLKIKSRVDELEKSLEEEKKKSQNLSNEVEKLMNSYQGDLEKVKKEVNKNHGLFQKNGTDQLDEIRKIQEDFKQSVHKISKEKQMIDGVKEFIQQITQKN